MGFSSTRSSTKTLFRVQVQYIIHNWPWETNVSVLSAIADHSFIHGVIRNYIVEQSGVEFKCAIQTLLTFDKLRLQYDSIMLLMRSLIMLRLMDEAL